jgi:hypothetical protein
VYLFVTYVIVVALVEVFEKMKDTISECAFFKAYIVIEKNL